MGEGEGGLQLVAALREVDPAVVVHGNDTAGAEECAASEAWALSRTAP
ncbi:hypothetical protein [Streptomyces sp. NPDC058632]